MNRLIDFKSRFRILKGGKISLIVSALLGSVVIANAAPSGGTVTSGTASISQNGAVTNINQDSSKASINWNDFSIESNETVNFNQPDSSSITLNRVVGNEKSVINGALNANGQVWILNSNGVLFNSTAKVNTAGILATTAELSDSDFQAGNYDFKNASENSVINLGTINVSNAGSVVLASNEVKNSGTIKAVKGKVHLVGADSYSLNLNGNSLVNLTVNKGVLDSMVENSGTIIANGGEVYLTTNAVNELLKGVVNNTGIIEANSLDGLMGKVEVFAHGGTAEVSGSIEATDGFVETSGKELNVSNETVIKAKTWLIDPTDVVIDDSSDAIGGATVGASVIETALSSSGGNTDVIIEADNDITINEDIKWNENKLTLTAGNDINVFATLDLGDGNGTLDMNYDSTDGNIRYGLWNETEFRGKVNFGARTGTDLLNINSVGYTILNIDDYSTSGPNNDSATNKKYYALGSDADFSSSTDTASWINNFYGEFDGLGNTISNLDTKFTYAYQGFIGYNYGTLRNIGFKDTSFSNSSSTSNQAIAIVGSNRGDIFGVKILGTTDYPSDYQMSYLGILTGHQYGKTSEVSVTGIVNILGYYVGGVFGSIYPESEVSDIYSNATLNFSTNLKANYSWGGIASALYETAENLHFDGILNFTGLDTSDTRRSGLGGIVGILGTSSNLGTVNNSTFSGTINTGENEIYGVGGIVGQNSTYSTETLISNSISSGTINIEGANSTAIGGIVGANRSKTTGEVTNSEFTGKINSDKLVINVGGIIGYSNVPSSNVIDNSSATGKINLTNKYSRNIGGVLGYLRTGSSISNVYIDESLVSINSVSPTVDIGNAFNTYHGKVVGYGPTDVTGFYFASIPYSLSNITSIYTYKGSDYLLSDLWNASTVFGSNYSSWVLGTDYSFVYDNSNVTGFTNAGTYSGISVDILKSGYKKATEGNITGSLKISKANATVTVKSDSKTYNGLAQTVSGFTASGLVNNETISVLDNVSLSTGSQNVGEYTVKASGSDENYNLTFVDGSLTITPKAITVSADDLSKVYGQEDETLTYTATGLLGEDTLVGSLKRAAGENAGDYTISENAALTNSNYKVTFTDGKYTITPKAITVSADDLTKVYGQEDATLTYKATGLLGEDTLAGSLKREVGEDVADYAISQGTLTNSNYKVTFTDGKYTITPKAITVSADNLTKVYGQEDETLTYTATGLLGEDTLVGSLKRAAGENAGDYTISENTALTNSNYTVTFTDGKYTITPKAITVSADDLSKVYGQEDAALTYSTNGLVGEDTLVGSLKRAAGENAGDYTISENVALTNSNYTVTFENGKYTITPKAITVSADDLTKVYGQEDAALTYTANGLETGDTLVGSLKRAEGEDAGEYTISQDTALTNSNYTVTFTDGKYTITPKAIEVRADDLTKVYGDEDEVLTYTANGLVGQDTLAGILQRVEGEDAGDYEISQGNLANSNYVISFENGIYTITPATNSNIDNIIATIIKTNVKVPTAPVKVVVNNNPNIVSQPEAEEVATQIVTLSEIKTNQENSQTNEGSQTQQDVRVPISKNSVIELVNGGVNLPEGVDQQFFVANTDSQEN